MPTPNPVAFTIFNIDIMWYGILIVTGMVLATIIGMKRAPLHGIEGDKILDFMLFVIPAAIIGARLYYVIFNWSMYSGNLAAIINIRHGGLAIHGGLIAGFGVAAILCHVYKIKMLNLFDVAAPSVALGQAIGRWGNYFNGEAHGGPTDLPWAVNINGVGYHPTFLYESLWCLMLFIVLIQIDKHRKFDGQIICIYGILYSIERFFVEALRTDSLMIGPLKQAQVISLAIIIICGILYMYLSHKNKVN